VPQHHVLSLSSLAGRTGRGVRIAIIDSGIHASHPHIGGIADGIAIDDHGQAGDDVIDRIGHGTAVTAAIHEKAPQAELLVVKVFDRSLAATAPALAAAVRWAADRRSQFINLSLGTTNQEHAVALGDSVAYARNRGCAIVAAAPDATYRWLPGALAGVIAVELDWQCTRDMCRVSVEEDGTARVQASGYPRPIPGVAPERNLKGPSFAVANATGLLALLAEGSEVDAIEHLRGLFGRLEPPV
jgi:subtilisin family serine protease